MVKKLSYSRLLYLIYIKVILISHFFLGDILAIGTINSYTAIAVFMETKINSRYTQVWWYSPEVTPMSVLDNGRVFLHFQHVYAWRVYNGSLLFTIHPNSYTDSYGIQVIHFPKETVKVRTLKRIILSFTSSSKAFLPLTVKGIRHLT